MVTRTRFGEPVPVGHPESAKGREAMKRLWAYARRRWHIHALKSQLAAFPEPPLAAFDLEPDWVLQAFRTRAILLSIITDLDAGREPRGKLPLTTLH